jgi:hypothetical protein
MLNNDYKDILCCLSEEKVKFILVGAYALAAEPKTLPTRKCSKKKTDYGGNLKF